MKNPSGNMFLSLFRTAWRYAGDARPHIVLFYGVFLTANIIVAFQPLVLANIINTIQEGATATQKTLLWAGVYGGLTVIFWLLHGPARVIERRAGFTVFRNFVTALYRMITDMPLRWHQDHHSGETINRVNKAGRSLFNFTQAQFVFIQMAVRFGMSMILLGLYSGWVLAVSLLTSTIIVVLIRRFDAVLIPLIESGNEREHRLNAALYDYIGNIVTILTLRLQNDTCAEVQHRIADIKPPFWRDTVVNEWKWGMVNIVLVVTQVGIVSAYIVLHLWRHEALAVGTVVAIFQYLLMISQVFYDACQAYGTLMQRHTDVHTVDGLIADHARLVRSVATENRQDWQNIHVRNLSFTHHEGEDTLHHLRGVDLAIGARQKIALVGSSGSGKTTLLTLLRGLYETQRVQLAIDEYEFESLAPLAGLTTLVPQDSEIFENTILYNLTLGTEVPETVVRQALAVTTFDEVAATLPLGLMTDIRERGVNLSGGQKQRLALARGLIAARDSSLLLLDEPTSSVDLQTESVIFDRLFAGFAGKAIVASVHRLHLLPRFDHLVLMRDGRIVEQGAFIELLARRGEFYHLWQHHLAQSTHGDDIHELGQEI